MKERIYFLDNLRTLIIFLVLIFHAAVTFMAYPPEWWYVFNKDTSLLFTFTVLLCDVFMMPVLFFISGFFTPLSLQKHPVAVFIKIKFIHIALPWIIGTLFLAPIPSYFIYKNFGGKSAYREFWLSADFWQKIYSQAHFWFLGVLFVFFLLISLFKRQILSYLPSSICSRRSFYPVLVILILFPALGFFILNLNYGVNEWAHPGHILDFQPVRIVGYAVYFLVGIAARQKNWFSSEGYMPKSWLWVVCMLISGLLYLGFKLAVPDPAGIYKIIYALLHSSYACFTLFGVLVVSIRFLNFETRISKHFSTLSYGFYFVHLIILIYVADAVVKYPSSVFIKYLMVLFMSFILSWLASAVLKNLPLVKKVF